MPFPVIFVNTPFHFGKLPLGRGTGAWGRSAVVAVTLTAFLTLSLLGARAQVSTPVAEKNAADSVASLILEARRANGLSKLQRIEDPRLRADACARAQREDTRTWAGDIVGRAGSISGVAYSTSSADQPIPELLSFATRKEHWEAHRFAVGVCFVRSSQDPSGRYWIDVESYMSGIQTFFQRPFSS